MVQDLANTFFSPKKGGTALTLQKLFCFWSCFYLHPYPESAFMGNIVPEKT